MRTFIDPYLPPIFECEESLDTVDLCDSSGYLSIMPRRNSLLISDWLVIILIWS